MTDASSAQRWLPGTIASFGCLALVIAASVALLGVMEAGFKLEIDLDPGMMPPPPPPAVTVESILFAVAGAVALIGVLLFLVAFRRHLIDPANHPFARPVDPGPAPNASHQAGRHDGPEPQHRE